MTKVNNFYVPKVDSLQLRILLSEVEIIDTTLIDNMITIHEATGEIVKQKKGLEYKLKTEEGISFGFKVSQRKAHPNSPEINSELYVLVNSKHLKGRYFEGITKDNVDIIWEAVNSLNVIKISREAFLRSDILDVDLCIDFPANTEEFKENMKRLQKLAISTKADRVKSFNSEKNIGLELNDRNKSTPAKTFAKFYHKTTELVNNSTDFQEKYLKDKIDFNDIGRFEFNLKNRQYFRHYGIHGVKTLKQLLDFDTAKRVFQEVYRNWFVQREYRQGTSDRWYLTLLEEFYEVCNLGQIHEAQNRALARYETKKPQENIRKNYHTNMKGKLKQKAEEYTEISLARQLDLFFGVVNTRTYDVRTKRTDLGIDENIKIDKTYPY